MQASSSPKIARKFSQQDRRTHFIWSMGVCNIVKEERGEEGEGIRSKISRIERVNKAKQKQSI